MTCTLFDPEVSSVLEGMHTAADRDDPALLAKAEGTGGQQRADLLADAFIPVSPDAGQLLYTLVRTAGKGTVVEFGTSFGISAIYIAAALKDRGNGRLITTEIYPQKAERARQFIEQTGLMDYVDLRVGDAQETLADCAPDVSFVFLDGMKSLYLPVLKQLEPKLIAGALVVGDDLDLFPAPLASYLEYVRDPANGYLSVMLPVGDAMELSTRIA